MTTDELIIKLRAYSYYLYYNREALYNNNDISTDLPNLLVEVGKKLVSLDRKNQELKAKLDLYSMQKSIDRDNDYNEA